MKKLLILLFFFISITATFSQRIRTTPSFDADTTTRPKPGLYGIGVRSNRLFLLPSTGNTRKILEANTHYGSNGQYLFTNGTSNFFKTPTLADVGVSGLTNDFILKWNGTTFVNSQIFDNGTNVGIGMATPNYKLDIVTSSWNGVQITTNGSDRNSPALDLISGAIDMVISPDNISGKSWVGNYSNHGLSFHTNNIERVTILAGGNVGIGTTSPGNRLVIDGTTPITEIRSGGYLMLRPTNNTYDWRLQAVGSGATTYLGIFAGGFLSSPNMTFQIGGNVGIGLTNPAFPLDVNGTIEGNAFRLSANNAAPATSTTACTTGELRIDGNFIYYCSATNTWRRAALSTY